MERVVGVNGSNSKGVRAWMWGWRGEREAGRGRRVRSEILVVGVRGEGLASFVV